MELCDVSVGHCDATAPMVLAKLCVVMSKFSSVMPRCDIATTAEHRDVILQLCNVKMEHSDVVMKCCDAPARHYDVTIEFHDATVLMAQQNTVMSVLHCVSTIGH